MSSPHKPIEKRYRDEPGKQAYVRSLFDRGARHYDRIGSIGFLGTGQFNRRRALQLAGFEPGMDLLDVACGTGAVTRAALEIQQGKGRVVGIDPSPGMLAVAVKHSKADFLLGDAEALPFPGPSFDFLAMGYALRHVHDLAKTFAEYLRVLRPGGRLLLLEISRPPSGIGRFFAWLYFGAFLPRLSHLLTGSRDAREMMAYYWETIDACVPPEEILAALKQAGFTDVNRRSDFGIFSEYRASRPLL